MKTLERILMTIGIICMLCTIVCLVLLITELTTMDMVEPFIATFMITAITCALLGLIKIAWEI